MRMRSSSGLDRLWLGWGSGTCSFFGLRNSRCRFRLLDSGRAGLRGFDRVDAEAAFVAVEVEIDLVSGFPVEECLADGSKIADQSFLGIAVPGAENGKGLVVIVNQ